MQAEDIFFHQGHYKARFIMIVISQEGLSVRRIDMFFPGGSICTLAMISQWRPKLLCTGLFLISLHKLSSRRRRRWYHQISAWPLLHTAGNPRSITPSLNYDGPKGAYLYRSEICGYSECDRVAVIYFCFLVLNMSCPLGCIHDVAHLDSVGWACPETLWKCLMA